MKQETAETIQQNSIQEKKYKEPEQVLNIDYFYKIFLKEKRKYSPSLFCVGGNTRKKNHRAPTLDEFKKVVYEYLKTYFYELYFSKSTMYFCLGGFMKIVSYAKWSNIQKRSNLKKAVLHKSDGAMGLFWFWRPTMKMWIMLDIKKQSGSTNMITKIEREFSQRENKDLLPIFTHEQKKGKENKTLYRCIQK